MRVMTGTTIVLVCALAGATARMSATQASARELHALLQQGQGQQGQGQGQGQQGQRQGGGGQGGGQAQAPKNLQVLPKDWTTQQVGAFMRTYIASGTGMMCNDCHVQDRSADDKKEKQVGRQMLKMVMAINNDFLKDIGDAPTAALPAAGALKVTCYTCHRGQRKPINAAPSGGGGVQ